MRKSIAFLLSFVVSFIYCCNQILLLTTNYIHIMRNFFKNWLNAICCPRPVPWASNEVWQDFVNNASYGNVCKTLQVNDSLYFCWEKCTDNLRILCKRLAEGDWPVLSKDFIKKHGSKVIRVPSGVDVKTFVHDNCKKVEARYLIDENNQMLGIVLTKSIVITGLFYGKFSCHMAECCKFCGYVPTGLDIVPIHSNITDINNLLHEIGYNPIIQAYWFDKSGQISSVGMPFYHKRVAGDKDCAQMVFLAQY